MEEKQQPIVVKGRTIQRERRTPATRRVRSRVPAARSGSRTPGSRSRRRVAEEGFQTAVLVRKIGIAAIAVLLVLLLNAVDLPFTQRVVGHVRTAITKDFNWDDTIGQLKFVGDRLPDIQAVFGPSGDRTPGGNEDSGIGAVRFGAPARGQVISLFMESVGSNGERNQGIDIAVSPSASFFAAAAGQVAAVEDHDGLGKSVWINHGENIFTYYGGCSVVQVVAGQQVKVGETLGTVANREDGSSVLHFQIWLDEKPVDPLSYLPDSTANEGMDG